MKYYYYIKCLLKKILLIATRICYCVILCYLVYKHSCLLAYRLLIYIKIVPRDKLLGFNSIKGNITQSSKIIGCLTTVTTIAIILMQNLSLTCARLRALLFYS
ncbi:hypothetical protein HBI57_229660 [Parastagonospora nodorum]|nr:hypothetical protein HBI57_229660 [Parastagonospora nodorum]KAH6457263.1 hypothetical protein HBI58_195810 [Parastagonospora nodorum]